MLYVTSDFPQIILRLLVAVILAALTTVSLFLIMHKLIDHSFKAPVDTLVIPIPQIWNELKDRGVEERITKLVKPDELEQPPEAPLKEAFASSMDTDLSVPVKIDAASVQAKVEINSSRIPVAHVLRQPTYPARALLRGIEGWVDVKFDVSAQGKTQNIEVLASEPEGVFESSAIKAVRSWKYQPFVDGSGELRSYAGLTKRLSFEIQD